MPDTTDMSSVILELNAVATASGVEFISIAPQAPVAREGGFLAVPIKLTFEGSYYDLTDFLFRLRNLVIVRDGELESAGRLFTLDALDLHEGSLGLPEVQAAITLSAYSYSPTPAAVAPGTTPPTTTTPAPAEDPAAAIGTG
jgi:Tfp pilus assembly protein PilO